MSLDISFDFSGLDDLIKNLEDVDDVVISGSVKGVQKTLESARSTAVYLAPVKTNELREKIVANPVQVEGNEVSGDLSSTAPHGAYVEFGTGQRGSDSPSPPKSPEDVPYTLKKEHKKGGKGTGEFYDYMGQPAQPYMYPAFVEAEVELAQNIADEIMDEMKTLSR